MAEWRARLKEGLPDRSYRHQRRASSKGLDQDVLQNLMASSVERWLLIWPSTGQAQGIAPPFPMDLWSPHSSWTPKGLRLALSSGLVERIERAEAIRLYRAVKQRLMNIAHANIEVRKHVENPLIRPARVSNLQRRNENPLRFFVFTFRLNCSVEV